MKTRDSGLVVSCLILFSLLPARQIKAQVDLRDGVPPEAHLAVYGRHNPERDYQMEYAKDIWNAIQEEGIVEQFAGIVRSRVPENELQQVESWWDQLRQAATPIEGDAILESEEIVYAQVMVPPFNHHLFLIRLSSPAAADFASGIAQLFDLFEKWSDGEVAKRAEQEGDVHFLVLDLPGEMPFQPAMARIDDVVIVGSAEDLVRRSATLLLDQQAPSKFDDPRLAAALAQLPAPEDAVVFFDGRTMFEKMRGIPEFIRAQKPEQAEVARVCQIMDLIFDQISILDYEVTVQYTEGYQNREATIGKLGDDADQKLLYQAVSQGEAFKEWQTWIPASAEAYSLNTGVNLHVVYERVMGILRDQFPESHEALDQFEKVQQEFGVHLDRDILQAFSGESVSVTLPVANASGSKSQQQGVLALRCHKPERIRELINRGVNALNKIPAIEAQQLKLVESEELAGFYELRAATLAMFQVQPVIGFHDGWLLIGSNSAATGEVLAVRKGESETINRAESFQRFHLEVAGPIHMISYTDIGAAISQTADGIEQVGAIAPIFLAMIAAQADAEDLEPVQEIFAMLPSVARVVRKFDFMDQQLSVTRDGPTKDTYRRDKVVLIKAPTED